MIPTDFPESNQVIDKPPDMTRDECEPLNVAVCQDHSGQSLIISCWKLTKEELDEFQATGRIWCYHFGTQLQPHCLSANNPFKEPE